MSQISVREPRLEDKNQFLTAMQKSKSLHEPWVNAPLTPREFDEYFQRYQQPNQKSYLVVDDSNNILGVFNINEIIHGCFQNAFLGFYVVSDYSKKGYMSTGLKLILQKIFVELKLHRIEANIQPENISSIKLVQSNGFRYEGYSPRYLNINGEWRGHEHWAMTLEDFIRNDSDVLKKDHVNIVPYNSDWRTMAKLEIERLQNQLPPHMIVDIQHVGSTAIPGISAKPIIDIQIAVNVLSEVKEIFIPILQKLDYEYWDENPDTTRMFFVKGMPPFGDKRTHHVHVVEQASHHWRNKIDFRDYLRLHPETAKEYENLKLQLAEEHVYDREKYTDSKAAFIQQVLQLARGVN